MVVLGISEQHEAHACLVIDGEVKHVVAEERLSRLKTDSGVPIQAINKIFEIAKIEPAHIDCVAFASSSKYIWTNVFKKHALFEVEDWIEECEKYWRLVLLENRKDVSRFDYWDFFLKKQCIDLSKDAFGSAYLEAKNSPEKSWHEIGFKARCKALEQIWGIKESKVRVYRHEDCHKAYGYFASPFINESVLLFTIEGGGDDSSATLSKINENGHIEELWASNEVMLGRLYAYITLILGMKPGQHEYKVMGLAPYGNPKYAEGPLSVFRNINRVSGTTIKNCNVFPDLYFSMLEELKYYRFDAIACALQIYLEETVGDWVKNSVRKYGINNIIISGGAGQNIKLAKALNDLEEVKTAWHPPIAGDGSLGVGAAWLACEDHGVKQKQLATVYLGTNYKRQEIDDFMKFEDVTCFELIEDYTHKQIAEWLANGNVCARFSGKMEFGQRALGNRSIIADPRDYQIVKKINDKIKYRDFWMPFTPSMLEIEAGRFLKLKGNSYSPFMTHAYESLEETRHLIPAVIHPADFTVRPQILTEADNPSYYSVIKAFKDATGIGVILNTSFNLHGYPIVESPADAIRTFKESDLDILLFDHVAIVRTGNR